MIVYVPWSPRQKNEVLLEQQRVAPRGACAPGHRPRGGPLTRIKSWPLPSLRCSLSPWSASRLLCSALVFALAFAFSSAVVLALFFPASLGLYRPLLLTTYVSPARSLKPHRPPHSHTSSNPAHPKEAVASHPPSRYSPHRIRHSSPRRFGTRPRFTRLGWSGSPLRCWFHGSGRWFGLRLMS